MGENDVEEVELPDIALLMTIGHYGVEEGRLALKE